MPVIHVVATVRAPQVACAVDGQAFQIEQVGEHARIVGEAAGAASGFRRVPRQVLVFLIEEGGKMPKRAFHTSSPHAR